MSHLITCPECKKHLQVPDELIGKKVQCPECSHTFTAKAEIEEVAVSSKPSNPVPAPVPTAPPKKRAAWDSKDDDEGEEKENDDSYDVKKRRRRDDEDEDDDDRDRPRTRRRRSGYGNSYTPHRGGLILAFGIIGLVSGLGIIFGPIAWVMGNGDLNEMKSGRMDPEGEGMTQTGRILGMIATILSIVGIVIPLGMIGFFCCLGFFAAAADGNRNRRPR